MKRIRITKRAKGSGKKKDASDTDSEEGQPEGTTALRSPGPDLDSIAFTLSLQSTSLAEFFVCWAEISREQGTIFRMAPIRVHALRQPEDLRDFRRMFLSILRWGLGQRKREICAVIQQIRVKLATETVMVEDLEGETEDEDEEVEAKDDIDGKGVEKKEDGDHVDG